MIILEGHSVWLEGPALRVKDRQGFSFLLDPKSLDLWLEEKARSVSIDTWIDEDVVK